MTAYTAVQSDIIPLQLVVSTPSVGGVTTATPTVTMHRAGSPTFFLDWDDNILKSSGWTTKEQPLSHVTGGVYQLLVDLSVISPVVSPGDLLVFTYKVDEVALKGADVDTYKILATALDTGVLQLLADTSTILSDTTLLRKALMNRMEQTAGNPGQQILYDDDGTTPLVTWGLQDSTDSGIVEVLGRPVKRAAGT